MRRSGVANLPLHGGHCPKWLFERMVPLSKAISEVIIEEYDHAELLRRLSDPDWFQAFSCAIAFDWHSSGVTTTLMGSLKEALSPETGIAVCGGKGRVSRKTPQEIEMVGDEFSLSSKKIEEFKQFSRMAAKVDNAAVQDGFGLYHHCFVISERGDWIVVQQGMNDETRYARRYHWLGEDVGDFVQEPQKAICCDSVNDSLNMVANESKKSRKASVDLSKEDPKWVMRQLSGQKTLGDFLGPVVRYPKRHEVIASKDVNPKKMRQILLRTYESQISDYGGLLGMPGVGPATVRSLALLSELIYGEGPSWEDPCRYSFCLGGKDGFPYKPRLEHYDEVAGIMQETISKAKLGQKEKLGAIKRLNSFVN